MDNQTGRKTTALCTSFTKIFIEMRFVMQLRHCPDHFGNNSWSWKRIVHSGAPSGRAVL